MERNEGSALEFVFVVDSDDEECDDDEAKVSEAFESCTFDV